MKIRRVQPARLLNLLIQPVIINEIGLSSGLPSILRRVYERAVAGKVTRNVHAVSAAL